MKRADVEVGMIVMYGRSNAARELYRVIRVGDREATLVSASSLVHEERGSGKATGFGAAYSFIVAPAMGQDEAAARFGVMLAETRRRYDVQDRAWTMPNEERTARIAELRARRDALHEQIDPLKAELREVASELAEMEHADEFIVRREVAS